METFELAKYPDEVCEISQYGEGKPNNVNGDNQTEKKTLALSEISCLD